MSTGGTAVVLSGGDSPPFVKLIKAVGYPPRKT